MSVMLDVIGSTIIAGFVILMGLQLNTTMAGGLEAANANVNVQESMVDVVRTLEYDFRKIGYNIPDTVVAIVETSATSITFLSDINDDMTVDSVRWFLGPPAGRLLFRKVNDGDALAVGADVTEFTLRYLDQDGRSPYSMRAIAMIETTLRLESPYQVQDEVNPDTTGYLTAFWRQTRLSSRNLRRDR